jgi:hypothetical protein
MKTPVKKLKLNKSTLLVLHNTEKQPREGLMARTRGKILSCPFFCTPNAGNVQQH